MEMNSFILKLHCSTTIILVPCCARVEPKELSLIACKTCELHDDIYEFLMSFCVWDVIQVCKSNRGGHTSVMCALRRNA